MSKLVWVFVGTVVAGSIAWLGFPTLGSLIWGLSIVAILCGEF